MPLAIPTRKRDPSRSSKLGDFAFSFTIIALLIWMVGTIVGFFLTSLITLTPANWHTWVMVRLVLQIGGGLLVGLGILLNPMSWRSIGSLLFTLGATVLFALIGSLLGVNALRALAGPRTVEGTVISFHHGVIHSAFSEGTDYSRLELRQTDGKSYRLHLWGGAHTGDLYKLLQGCHGPGDRLRLTIVEPLDAPLSVHCLEHIERVTSRMLSMRKTFTEGTPIVVHYRGLPGNPHDWVTVIRSDEPTTHWGLWAYTNGQKSGDYRVPPQPPGRYDARVYLNDGIFIEDHVTFEVVPQRR